MISAKEVYCENIKINKAKSESLKSKINIIGILRLITVIIYFLADYVLYRNNHANYIFSITIIFLCVFLFLIYYHDILFTEKKKFDILVAINEDGLKRINGELNKIEDNGKEYLDENHEFCDDLDVFGHNSLFQIINTTVTERGRKQLVDILKRKKIFTQKDILERQESIKELSKKIKWRQELIVEGKIKRSDNSNMDGFIEWSRKKQYTTPLKTAIASTFIFVTLCSVFAVFKGIVPQSFILLVLMINFVVVKMLSRELKQEMILFNSIKGTISSYKSILGLIQNEKFDSVYLEDLRNKLLSNKATDLSAKSMNCSEAMSKLSNILDWVGDSRYNAFYFIINILFFSDVFLVRSLENWREKNGEHIEEWIYVMSRFDELCSFANLEFEHEGWSYPNITEAKIIDGAGIGHPLLGIKAVKNDFSLKNNNKTALITGSNMSGKSTFLRTIGVNLLLSYVGAPVCAERFSCGIMNLYTCMRTKDNLEESISSFYAEILRIKLLIEASKKGEKVFFLLDEIFKGTNSHDRHVGASTLIKQLIKYDGMGLVSTHDLELCDLEKENSGIINYNFREFYTDNKIKFDYKLRQGKSETRNAVHLMKLAGIDII